MRALTQNLGLAILGTLILSACVVEEDSSDLELDVSTYDELADGLVNKRLKITFTGELKDTHLQADGVTVESLVHGISASSFEVDGPRIYLGVLEKPVTVTHSVPLWDSLWNSYSARMILMYKARQTRDEWVPAYAELGHRREAMFENFVLEPTEQGIVLSTLNEALGSEYVPYDPISKAQVRVPVDAEFAVFAVPTNADEGEHVKSIIDVANDPNPSNPETDSGGGRR